MYNVHRIYLSIYINFSPLSSNDHFTKHMLTVCVHGKAHCATYGRPASVSESTKSDFFYSS